MNSQPKPSHADPCMPRAQEGAADRPLRSRIPVAAPVAQVWPVAFEVEPWRP